MVPKAGNNSGWKHTSKFLLLICTNCDLKLLWCSYIFVFWCHLIMATGLFITPKNTNIVLLHLSFMSSSYSSFPRFGNASKTNCNIRLFLISWIKKYLNTEAWAEFSILNSANKIIPFYKTVQKIERAAEFRVREIWQLISPHLYCLLLPSWSPISTSRHTASYSQS